MFLGILVPPNCGIGATICIGREMLCLPYAGFFFSFFVILSKALFTQLLGKDIHTHTHTWTHIHTFLHIGPSDLENRFQWWVFNCVHTVNATHWKDHHFSQALVWCLSWVEQYSTNVAVKIVLRCSVSNAQCVCWVESCFQFQKNRMIHDFLMTDSDTR